MYPTELFPRRDKWPQVINICQIHREWERGLINGEFIVVLLTQPDVYDIVRDLKSVAHYKISFIPKAGFRLSTLYMNALLRMSAWNQMLY
jgi:hypothetical protein